MVRCSNNENQRAKGRETVFTDGTTGGTTSIAGRFQTDERLELFQRAGRTEASTSDGDLASSQFDKAPSIVERLLQHEQRLAVIEHLLSVPPIQRVVLPNPDTMQVTFSPYLDSAQAAAYLKISVGSLYGLVERRQMEPLRGTAETI